MEKFKNKTALIADDDIEIVAELNELLKEMGLNVIETESQKEAEEAIENRNYDIAIFDLMMENRDSGFILSYKSKKKHPNVPVIIISSATAETGMLFNLESEEDRKWIKADCYLEKGMRNEQIILEIIQLLNR